MSKKFNMPTLVINGDLNDLRCYLEEQARTNIEAFIDMLQRRRLVSQELLFAGIDIQCRRD